MLLLRTYIYRKTTGPYEIAMNANIMKKKHIFHLMKDEVSHKVTFLINNKKKIFIKPEVEV